MPHAAASRIAWAGVCALVLVAPFEALTPLVEWPGQLITSVEAALAIVFVAWFAALAWTRSLPLWRTPLTTAWMVFVAAMFVAAVAAPDHRANAMHMAGRFAAGFGVFLLTVNGTTTAAQLRGVLVAAAAAGAIAGTLVVLEYAGIGPVIEWLVMFRERLWVIGPQIRAGGPFQYPTMASMYLEIVFALVLALLLMTVDARRRATSVVVFLLLASIAAAMTFTFTRAGLVTLASTLIIVGWLRYRRQGLDAAVKAMVALSVLAGVLFLATRPAESVTLRMTTEAQQSWYSAGIQAPAELAMSTGEVVSIPVTLTNHGRVTWDPGAAAPFLLSYHWLDADGDRVVEFEGLRTVFPEIVAPGASVVVNARVRAPGIPGRYRLFWDVVLERRLWFSMEPNAERVLSSATVTGLPAGPPPVTRVTRMPRPPSSPGRLTLWRAGARVVQAHPLLGVGPDNFRLIYGRYIGLADFDTRMHTHNMYLEMFAGGGIIGGAAFAWLCAAVFMLIVRAVRKAGPQHAAAVAGVTAAVAAIALHGMVDSFLGFTATYILIAITLGLAAKLGSGLEN